jgi:hypothetical protein
MAKKKSKLDSLLIVLDKEIINTRYKDQKEREIIQLRKQIDPQNLDIEKQYYLYTRATDEYEFFRCDSARIYALKSVEIAEKIGDPGKITDSKIQLGSILFKAAMFNETIDLLGAIDEKDMTKTQKYRYYKAYYETYVSWIDFYEDGYIDDTSYEKRDYYYEKFLEQLTPDTYEYASYYGIKYIITGELDKAEDILLRFLSETRFGTRSYSVLASVSSFLYDRKGDSEKVKEYLALSALSDIKGNIMENLSLRTLATVLYEEGQTERANTYIKKSMEDANFYNARIRNIQTFKVLPIIDKAYQTDKAKQQKKLQHILLIISILSFGLLIGIVLIIPQIRKVSIAKKEISKINRKLKSKNEALAQTNLTLAETNRIKEEYIGHFLSLCSVYIEKIEKYQQKLFNKARTSTADELYKAIKSTQFIKDEREEFYNNFDNSFLKLFPTFVNDFNALFPEDDRIVLKVNEKLTTELRIFALIRLSVTDSNKIAEFLNYSLATIYNYRSRFRNKSIGPSDEFENEIMKIGTGN